jgi:hypothetical protein
MDTEGGMGYFVTEYQGEREYFLVQNLGRAKFGRPAQQDTRRYIFMVKRFIQAKATTRAAFTKLEIVTQCAL